MKKSHVCSLHHVPSSQEIVLLRKQLGMTQLEFAALIGVSMHTLKSWEYKQNTPSGASSKTLNMLRSQPEVVCALLKAA